MHEQKDKRITGFTAVEKEFRTTPEFMAQPNFWKKHVVRMKKDYENMFNRYTLLDEIGDGDLVDLKNKYDEQIDGLVVDEMILREEMAALELSLRAASDYLFEGLPQTEKIYDFLLVAIKGFKKLRAESDKLGNDVSGLYERAMVERGNELLDLWDRESTNTSKGDLVKRIELVCEKADVKVGGVGGAAR